MRRQRIVDWTCGPIWAAVVLCVCLVPACRAETQAVTASGANRSPGSSVHAMADGAAELPAATAHLQHLAEAGRFGEVLTRLRSDYAGVQDPDVHQLVRNLERFDASAQERAQQRQAEHDKALAQVSEELERGHIEDALIAAIDAHRLAATPADLLADPAVQAAVKRGEAEAQAAEQGRRWIQALTLYRALDLLYNDYATYRGDVERIAKHVQVLQLYAPEELRKLYEAHQAQLEAKAQEQAAAEAKAQANAGQQADAQADDTSQAQADTDTKAQAARDEALDDQPPSFQSVPWQTQLKGINVAMLRQTLLQAARQHVSGADYTSLIRGALDSLLLMLRTDRLSTAFAQFANQDKRQQFEDQLLKLRDSLDQPDASLNYLDTVSMIQKVLAINDKTLALPRQVVVYELAQGATGTLDDFSAVIWPQEKEQFSRSTQGTFYGVGIQISKRDGRLVVVTPLPGTPAQAAGVKAGDVIAQVDGQDTASWSLEKAVRQITGPEGTPVVLGIERVGQKGLIDTKIHRAEIEIRSIRGWELTAGDAAESDGQADSNWNYWIDPEHRIGYIRLSQFIPQTADDLDAAVAQMQQTGPIHGLILDLRFNPGGLLSSAIEVVDRFIEEGPIVFTVDADRHKTHQSRAHGKSTYPHFPVVVLINQGSASASEIVSGALQDYGRALIVGTRSFGKGSVQDLFPLSHGEAYLKLTTQYYMLPMGRIIHREPDDTKWGIEPDLIIEMTNQQIADAIEYRQKVDVLRNAAAADAEGEAPPTADAILKKGLDPQLSAALLILQTRQIAQDIAMAQAPRTDVP